MKGSNAVLGWFSRCSVEHVQSGLAVTCILTGTYDAAPYLANLMSSSRNMVVFVEQPRPSLCMKVDTSISEGLYKFRKKYFCDLVQSV